MTDERCCGNCKYNSLESFSRKNPIYSCTNERGENEGVRTAVDDTVHIVSHLKPIYNRKA